MLVLRKKPNSNAAEAYRGIRTNLQYSFVNKNMKSLVVTSCERGEGKSIVCSNLALALCDNGKKVIVLDCNLRNPTIHKYFEIDNNRGIYDVLLNHCSVEEAIHIVEENFHLITCGEVLSNEWGILDSEVMDNLLQDLALKYDVIIIDTPPIHYVSDGLILAKKVDGTILVVKSEKTKKDSIIDGKKALDKVNANIIGTVLNSVSLMAESHYHHKSIGVKSLIKGINFKFKNKFMKN